MRGVYLNKATQKWRATLRGAGIRKYLGEFQTEAEAITARIAAEVQVHGEPHAQDGIVVTEHTVEVPIYSRNGQITAWAIVDRADLSVVEKRRWSMTKSGYAVARIFGKSMYLHRLILPKINDEIADHINGNKLDCRRSNLRRCSSAENARNKRNISKNNTIGFKGIRKTAEGKWAARIWKDRKYIHLGHYDTREDAANAYDEASLVHHGAFASPNKTELMFTPIIEEAA